jgi:hypothetical protein
MFDPSKLMELVQQSQKVGAPSLPWNKGGESGGLPSGSAIEPFDVAKSFTQGGAGSGFGAMGANLQNHLATQGGEDFKNMMTGPGMAAGAPPPAPGGAPAPQPMQPNPAAIAALQPQSPFTSVSSNPGGAPGGMPGQMPQQMRRSGPIFNG